MSISSVPPNRRTPAPAKSAKAKTRSRKTPAVAAKPESLLQWAQRYCRERGHDYEFAKQNHVVLAAASEARSRGYNPAQSGLIYQNIHPLDGSPLNSSRIRYQDPPLVKDKKTGKERLRKFNQLRDTEAHPYFASCLDWKRIFADPRTPVIITEGETRSLAGAKYGFHVIALGGVDSGFAAGTRRSELVPILKQIKWKKRVVTLIFDADIDTNGRVKDALNALAHLLTGAGAEVHIAEMPSITADGKAGVDDLLALEGGAVMLKALCAAAPVWSSARAAGIEPITRTLSDIENEAVDWIWKGRIARGAVTMFSGDPGSAKTFVALSVAADLTRGRIPADEGKCKALRILYATVENDAAQVIGPRFRAMGGDDTRFVLLDDAVDTAGKPLGISFANLAPVERAIEKHRSDIVVFDPIQSFFGADADFHKANEVRPRMDNLMRVAKKHNVAVLLIRHLAKSSGGRAIHRGLGSIDFTGAVRVEFMIGHRADKPDDKAIVTLKTNLGKYPPALRFALEGEDMKAKIVWKGESVLTAGDLTAPEKATGKNGVSLAVEFLREQLQEGPKLFRDLLNAGSFGRRMLERASHLAGVKSRRNQARGPVEWYLPGREKKGAK